MLALRAFFQNVVSRADMLRYQLAIFFSALFSLFELPLPFEQRRFVYESEDIVERNVLDDARAVKRGAWNRRVLIYV